MSIKHYIKEIGRGKDGARPLSREQAHDLMGQILDEQVSNMELGISVKELDHVDLPHVIRHVSDRKLNGKRPWHCTSVSLIVPGQRRRIHGSYEFCKTIGGLDQLLHSVFRSFERIPIFRRTWGSVAQQYLAKAFVGEDALSDLF